MLLLQSLEMAMLFSGSLLVQLVLKLLDDDVDLLGLDSLHLLFKSAGLLHQMLLL